MRKPRVHKSGSGAGIARRHFLKSSALAAGALAVPGLPVLALRAAPASTPPSERIGVGVIGVGLMGSGHLRRLVGDSNFQVLGVCDADRVRRDNAKNTVEAHYGAERASGVYRGCQVCTDYRELLARPDIDAVLIATPDHWHSLQSIDAAKAGKDIYCEKPISVTIEEGRRVVEAVRRYGRVFQTGTQYRSIPTIRRVCEFVREGGLGKVKSAFTLLTSLAGFMGAPRFQRYAGVINLDKCGRSFAPLDFALPGEPVPEGLDWEMWVGPAPWRPFNSVYHVNPSPGVVPWSFSDAFGVTSSTWFLSHAADVIQYALGEENSGPVEIIHPSSGRYPTLTCRYASGTLLHFVGGWEVVKDVYKAVPSTARLAGNFGGVFVGERGWLTSMSTGGPVEGGPAEVFDSLALPTREVNIGANNHHANWLECIRQRKRTYCDEELGHRTSSLGLLTNIAFVTGDSLHWDPAKEIFTGNDSANRLRSRATRAPWRI